MRLELGRRGDYAVRAMVDLARNHDGGGRRKTRDIAEAMDVPPGYIPQILAVLVRAGLAESEAGPSGGYRLARPPATISLLDVIVAVEGDISSTECVLRGGPCRWEGVCAVHEPWSRAQEALRGELAAATLEDVARADAALEAGEG
jgi:Rrf2 family transcriptional regulator, iron-sulfur cluster assembly transcription factor